MPAASLLSRCGRRSIGENVCKKRKITLHNRAGCELAGARYSWRRVSRPIERARQGGRKSSRLSDRHDFSIAAVVQDFSRPAACGRNDRQPRRQGLDNDGKAARSRLPWRKRPMDP